MNAITLLAAKSREFRTFVAEGGGLWGTLWRCVSEMAEDDNEYLRVAALGVICMYMRGRRRVSAGRCSRCYMYVYERTTTSICGSLLCFRCYMYVYERTTTSICGSLL
jgi:hypothetical protein